MSISKPYKRNARIFVDGEFNEGGRDGYVSHKKYAQHPEHYIRAYLLIQKDLQELFDYIEPADKNLKTYSYRIHQLLLRTCIEIEANFKAILRENIYSKSGDLKMGDYQRIDTTHRLSSYEVKLPVWNGTHKIRIPFLSWKNNESLNWYRAYNETKHDRHTKFENATFECLIDAICGLMALLTSQFLGNDFSSVDFVIVSDPNDGMESAIGSYFRVKYPTDWSDDEMYDFKWQDIKDDLEPFNLIDYNQIT